jgi:hypothetical protein
MGCDFKAFFIAEFFIKVSKMIFHERGRPRIWCFAQSYPQKMWTTAARIVPAGEMNSAIIRIQAMAHMGRQKRETLSAVHHTSRWLADLAIDRLFHHGRGLGH